MKKTIVVFALLLCLALCGCANAIQTPTQDKLMADIFNAIENEDYDSAKQAMTGVISEDNLDNALPAMSDYIKGTITDYTKIGYYYHITTSLSGGDKTETETLTYNVKTQYDDYVVEMVLLKTTDVWNVYGYNIIEASQAPVNGKIIDFSNFDVLQLVMLIFSAAAFGLIIYTIVMYAKSRIRLKALWIILIIILQSGIAYSKTSSGLSLQLMVLFFDISKLLKYANGDYIFTLVIPVGAIVFLCLRRRLISSTEAYYGRKAAINYPPSFMGAPQPYYIPNTDVHDVPGTEKETDKGKESGINDDGTNK